MLIQLRRVVMTVEANTSYIIGPRTAKNPVERTVIKEETIKAILYLGIRGKTPAPEENQGTIDTFA